MNGLVVEWMCGRVHGRKVRWVGDWVHDWMNACVRCLLVVDLLGLWRGVKPVSLSAGWPLAGIYLPQTQATTNKRLNKHIHHHALIIHPPNPPSVHSPTHPFTRPIHSPIHPFTYPPVHPLIHASTWMDGWQ